ncbi:MAG: cysteine hydrolase [Proteobacteria bacterium]|nr:cysteine hydrolase [Pseudomonadota bacterium]
MHFSTQHAAILAIDLQRAFCCDDGSVAAQGRDVSSCRTAADKCLELVAAGHAANLPVIYTRMCYRHDYADGGLLMRELRPTLSRIGALRDGTPDAELVPEIELAVEDTVIGKQRYSAFYGTSLEPLLRSLKIDTLIVGGVTTSMCVETTVRDAAQRDYRTFVVEETCGDFAADRHQASLAAMSFGFAGLLSLDEACAAIAAGGQDFPDR